MQETATSSRSSFLIEDLHAFMKISGVLAILAFVALHQNKMIDLVGILGIDSNLKNAFETLLLQTFLIGLFSGSIILSLWNFELLATPNAIYAACECNIVVMACWMVGGLLILRQAQRQIQKWKNLEENATNTDYIKLKEQQYERFYYQMGRNPNIDLPVELINEV